MKFDSLKKSTDSDNRLLYSHINKKYVVDFKLADGKITGYSPD